MKTELKEIDWFDEVMFIFVLAPVMNALDDTYILSGNYNIRTP